VATGKHRERLDIYARGWATADPKGAMEWLALQPPDQQGRLTSAFLRGLANSDPAAALSYIGTHLLDQSNGLMTEVFDGVVQRNGIQKAEEMLSSLRTRADISENIKGAYYWNLATRQIHMARLREDPESILDWADRTAGVGL